MFLRASYFCVLSLLIGVCSPTLSYADFEIKPVPFNAKNFSAHGTLQDKNSVKNINIQSITDIEPAAGTKSPEPYYMVTIDSIPVEPEKNDSLHSSIAAATVEKTIAENAPTSISTGQKLKVAVEGESELTAIYSVKTDGTIDFPLLGKIALAKLSPQEASERVAAGLKNGYLVEPKVSVSIIALDPIFVLGDVINPGQPLYNETLSIASAIQNSGGYKGSATENTFEILHTKDPDQMGLFPVKQDNETLKSGDILIVKGN